MTERAGGAGETDQNQGPTPYSCTLSVITEHLAPGREGGMEQRLEAEGNVREPKAPIMQGCQPSRPQRAERKVSTERKEGVLEGQQQLSGALKPAEGRIWDSFSI